MEIKKLGFEDCADFKSLIEIFKDVLESDEPIANDEKLQKLLSNPDFWVFVIKINSQVVGGLTIYVLHNYYDSKPVAYIYDVGVSTHFQRQGLGKALMEEVYSFCKKNGFKEAYVEAESEDIDAVSFYRKTKFSSQIKAIHFTYNFSE